ncbi:MAG: 6-carboxytetrahydropterin synthase [Acidobacteriaceae bacterium]|nr:6-carboxytetrahydropterin synthase [Acidobacteriaceae bacterium]MBV9296255.1 6-carboxytetrahydropterin synthase [Acidobacteriaceae bacterium]MBV9764027.1 6-carboxytetrahydropterin synthase [Acidobacteriaceae bacterium]
MFVTRKAEFSASHVCRVPSLSDQENQQLYGEGANPNGHGHNYLLEVTVEGDPDPATGMVINLQALKEILLREVVEPMDHRFLNYEVEPFHKVVPTPENIAGEIWRRLENNLQGLPARLARVRLYETPDHHVDIVRGDLSL